MAAIAPNFEQEIHEITQTLQKDIIEFLSSKYTSNATISIHEVMRLYDCPQDRAQRVLNNLVKDQILALVDTDVYVVIV